MSEFQETSLIKEWIKIGKKNPWIREACDPEFNIFPTCECKTIEELEKQIEHGNWCLGQAFFYKNLCFINQVDGGDEWLTIKDDYAFESYTFARIIKRGAFEKEINKLLAATKEQCQSLTYDEVIL